MRNTTIGMPNGNSVSRRPIAAGLSHLSGGRLEGDWGNGIVRRLEAKEHLFTEGDPKTHLYKVASGVVCLYKVLFDGRRQVVDFAYEDDVIGLCSAPVEALNAQALVLTRLKCLPVRVLLTTAKRDAKVALKLYEALSRELAATRNHLLCVGQRGATERLATFLLILSRRNEARRGEPKTIKLPMTRADIAGFPGSYD